MSRDREVLEVAREEMRQWLAKYTHCKAQSGFLMDHMDDASWPCATCVLDFLTELGLTDKNEEYHEHCTPPDRRNEVWRAILQIRETNLYAREEETVHESQ